MTTRERRPGTNHATASAVTRIRNTREQFQELTGYEAESISGLAQGAQHRARDDAWQRAAATAERVDATLAGLAVDSRQRPPQRPQLSGARGENVLNAAYLVDAARTGEFAALARRLDAEAAGTRIELTGPWAPDSFALPDDQEPA
jgi:Gas vesicle synthesis protein GvpL/GvpF